MGRTESRFITKLTAKQVEKLEQTRDYDESKRARHRAHAILLSYQRTSVNELVKTFSTSRNTICNWLDRWDTNTINGLHDLQRPGAPPKLDEQEQARALELLELTPQNSNQVLHELEKELGKTISSTTLKRIAKKNNLIWKRMRKSLRSKRDQKIFASPATSQ